MLHKLLHKLFGWDYIQWDNGFGAGIARVHKSPDGRIWFWQYKCTKVSADIVSPRQVLWLTCHPDKYFKTDDEKLEDIKEWISTIRTD